MTDLLLHDLDEVVTAGLRRRAARHGRDVATEAADILRSTVAADASAMEAASNGGLGTRIARRFAEVGLTEAEAEEARHLIDGIRGGDPPRPMPLPE